MTSSPETLADQPSVPPSTTRPGGMPTARREAVREFQREASSWVLRLTLACLPEGCTFPREVNCAQGDFRRG
jgi:hypothetical protein